MKFDEQALASALSGLGGEDQAAFAALCAERLLPLIADQRSAELGAAALDCLWRRLGGEPIAAAATSRLAESIEAAVPDEDAGDWSQETAFTKNALAAVAYSLRCLERHDPRYAVWAARQTIETLDLMATTRHNIDPNASGYEDAVLADPALQRELRRQHEDLEALSKGHDTRELSRLREQAQHEARTFLEAA